MLVANVNQGPSAVVDISKKLKSPENLLQEVINDVELGTRKLIDLAGNADGLQLSADKLSNTRHFSNTLFNIMRGGIFDENYQIEKNDFVKYIVNANRKVLKKKEALISINFQKNFHLTI